MSNSHLWQPHLKFLKFRYPKKTSFLCFAFLFIILKGDCQITKGNWLIGGNATLKATKYRAGVAYNQNITEIEVNPNIGYFLLDKFSAGLKTGIGLRRAKFNDDDVQNTTTLKVGPFVRYYFLPVSNMVNILAEGSYQYTTGKNTLKANTISFFTGPVIFLNNVVGLEFLLGYSSVKYSMQTGVDNSAADNSILVNVGFQIHLEKNK